MRNISKGVEPQSLTRHRCNASSNYENYREKSDLRESLVKEQRGICCYCMQRIRSDAESMKIEHWQCQSRFPEKQLDYSNLLGACLGCQGEILEKQHCDTHKGDRDLTYNPANSNHDIEGKLAFLGDGTIKSDNQAFNSEINEILNLNQEVLVRNRKATLVAIRKGLMNKNPSKANIQKQLRKWNGESDDGNLEPFCQVIIYYLRKKLRQIQ